MSDWSNGYVTNIAYTNEYFRNLSPHLIAFAAREAGLRTPPTDAFRYCELGMGRGKSLLFNAAANPDAAFWGVDFMPEHVAEAQAIADAAGLTNLTLSDDDFETLLTRDLPSFHYVALHGVWSWVDDRNRAILLAFLKRQVAPGGLVSISYNAMPGWASLGPLKELIAAHVGDERIDPACIPDAVKFAVEFLRRDMPGAPLTRLAAETARKIEERNANYIAHEYLNVGGKAFYFHEVAAALEEAKLTFAGPTTAADYMTRLSLPEDVKTSLDIETSPARRIGLMDFATGATFRHDVFARGMVPAEDAGAARRASGIALTRPAGRAQKDYAAHRLADRMPLDAVSAMLRKAAGRDATVGDLLDAATSDGASDERADEALALLINDGVLEPSPGKAKGNRASSLNSILSSMALKAGEDQHLLSPATRAGQPVNIVELLFLEAAQRKADSAKHALKRLEALGAAHRLPTGAPPLETLQAISQGFQAHYAPILRGLGVANK